MTYNDDCEYFYWDKEGSTPKIGLYARPNCHKNKMIGLDCPDDCEFNK